MNPLQTAKAHLESAEGSMGIGEHVDTELDEKGSLAASSMAQAAALIDIAESLRTIARNS